MLACFLLGIYMLSQYPGTYTHEYRFVKLKLSRKKNEKKKEKKQSVLL